MSSDRPPEFFFDRSLGRKSAQLLRDAGWIVHLIADHYPDDATNIADIEWIRDGCRRGWALLTKDRHIRYRAEELAALDGQLFCLSSGNLGFTEMATRFDAAREPIERAVARGEAGFWLVYDSGRIAHKWP